MKENKKKNKSQKFTKTSKERNILPKYEDKCSHKSNDKNCIDQKSCTESEIKHGIVFSSQMLKELDADSSRLRSIAAKAPENNLCLHKIFENGLVNCLRYENSQCSSPQCHDNKSKNHKGRNIFPNENEYNEASSKSTQQLKQINCSGTKQKNDSPHGKFIRSKSTKYKSYAPVRKKKGTRNSTIKHRSNLNHRAKDKKPNSRDRPAEILVPEKECFKNEPNATSIEKNEVSISNHEGNTSEHTRLREHSKIDSELNNPPRKKHGSKHINSLEGSEDMSESLSDSSSSPVAKIEPSLDDQIREDITPVGNVRDKNVHSKEKYHNTNKNLSYRRFPQPKGTLKGRSKKHMKKNPQNTHLNRTNTHPTPISIEKRQIKEKRHSKKLSKHAHVDDLEIECASKNEIHRIGPKYEENRGPSAKETNDKISPETTPIESEKTSDTMKPAKENANILSNTEYKHHEGKHISYQRSFFSNEDSKTKNEISSNAPKVIDDASRKNCDKGDRYNPSVDRIENATFKKTQRHVLSDCVEDDSSTCVKSKNSKKKRGKNPSDNKEHRLYEKNSLEKDFSLGFENREDSNKDEEGDIDQDPQPQSSSYNAIENVTSKCDNNDEENDDKYFNGLFQDGIDDSPDMTIVDDEDNHLIEFEPNDSFSLESNRDCESLSTFELLVKPAKFKKRNRTIMSDRQSDFLKRFFTKNPFPNTSEREELGRLLNMRPRTVQIWFQNMRQKNKSKIKNFCPNNKTKNIDTTKENSENSNHGVSLERIRPSNFKLLESRIVKRVAEEDANSTHHKQPIHKKPHLEPSSSKHPQGNSDVTSEYQQKLSKTIKALKEPRLSEKNEKKEQFILEQLDLRGLNALAELADNILDQEKKPKSQR